MPAIFRLIPLVLLLAAPAAMAQSSAAEAEHTRLTEEMKRLSGRSAWKGVDDAYKRLEALATDDPTVKLSYRDHYMGAVASRELGDINSVYVRLKRAVAAEANEEVTGWLGDIEQNFGPVKLKVDGKYPGDSSLVVAEMPFDPGQRRVIEAAQVVLSQSRLYEGILPLGKYTFGGREFEVVAGGATVAEITLEAQSVRGGSGGGGLSYVGPRLDLGAVFTSSTAPGTDASTQPGAFSGAGARVGVGVELGFSTRVGVLAEVGYHNLLVGSSDVDVDADVPYTLEAPSMHMGFGWLAAAYRIGDLRIAAGPVLGVGTHQASGAVTVDESLVSAGSATESYGTYSGNLVAAGGELGLFYGFLNFGNLQGGLGFHAGAQSSSSRWYPWGQLAFTLAPAAYRRDG